MILVVVAIALSTAVGVAVERRDSRRAHEIARRLIALLLYVVLPFVGFFTIARLHLTAGVGAGLVLAYLELAVVGVLAYLGATRLFRMSRPQTGALICVVILANTGYLGVPLCGALLGGGAVGAAVAFDAVVSGPMFYGVAFAVGAAFGTKAGDTRRERLRSFFARNPPLIAVTLGLLAPESLAPDVLHDAARVLVYAILPVGFFILGVNLAGEEDEGVRFRLTAPVGYALILRLGVAPLLMVGLSALTVKVPDAYLVQAAMPAGINSLVVAHSYGLDVRLCASVLAFSTAIVIVAALVAAPFI